MSEPRFYVVERRSAATRHPVGSCSPARARDRRDAAALCETLNEWALAVA